MIDTDKYEGHTPGPWSVGYEGQHDLPKGDIPINALRDSVQRGLIVIAYEKADAQLIADAPNLLAEIKRFHQIQNDPVDVLGCWYWLSENYPDIAMEYQDGDGDNR